MKQQTLAVAGFERYGRQAGRAEFLAAMELVVPWADLVALIEPHYAKPGNGRPPVGVSGCHGFIFCGSGSTCPPPGVEDALYDSLAMRGFVGIDLGREPAPDETTVCKFPSSVGTPRTGQADVEAGQRVSGEAWVEDRHGDHRRRDHPRRAVFNQQPERPARPRDASGEEGTSGTSA